jgi:hypothetical protein
VCLNRRAPEKSANEFLVIAPANFTGQFLAIVYLVIALFGLCIHSVLLIDYQSATKTFVLPAAALLWAYDINN